MYEVTLSATARQEDVTVKSTTFTCDTCQRFFRRRKDIARRKCQITHARGLPKGNPVSSVCHLVAEGYTSFKVKVCAPS